MKVLTILFLTGLLAACSGGQRSLLQVQLCFANAEDMAHFVEVMRSVSESNHMQYRDRSAVTRKELATLQQSPGYSVLNVSAHDAAGVGWAGGNLGLSAYEVSIGFTEGTNPAAGHAFAEDVIRRLSSRWAVYKVPSNRGALPRCRKQAPMSATGR